MSESLGRLRKIITASALVLALAHILFPSVKIDIVTVILLLVAVAPWLAPLVKSVELPGGFKIELHEVKAAAEQVTRKLVMHAEPGEFKITGHDAELKVTAPKDPIREGPAQVALKALRSVAGTDPNLALVGFRIEIEKRLRRLALKHGIPETASLSRILQDMRDRELLPNAVLAALRDLIAFGNRAAHGIPVEPDAADWVLSEGAGVLEVLDAAAGN